MFGNRKTLVLVVLGQAGDAQTVAFGMGNQLIIALVCRNLHKKMESGVFLRYVTERGERAFFDCSQKCIADAAVVGAHPVDMFFKIIFGQETCKGVLLEVRDSAGVEA